MGKASELTIAFVSGFAIGTLIWLLAAMLSACASNTRIIPADERAVLDIQLRIDALTREKIAMLKAIEKRKEDEKSR